MASIPVNLIQGEDGLINLYFIYKTSKRPFSLDGLTELEVRIPKASGVLIKKYSLAQVTVVGVPELGHVSIALTETETALFKVADGQAIFAQVDIGSTRKRFNKAGVLNVAKEAVAAT